MDRLWFQRCTVCDIREGACIQCSKNSCFLAFHATCARKEHLLMPMKATTGSTEPPTLQCFCERHIPVSDLVHCKLSVPVCFDTIPNQREQAEARIIALEAEEQENQDPHASPKSSKTARAYAKTYKPGPPLVPAMIVNRLSTYIHKIGIRKRVEFVEMVCRYWSLKREARRGAPLLKRLHLEPWTASASNSQQTKEEKALRLEVSVDPLAAYISLAYCEFCST